MVAQRHTPVEKSSPYAARDLIHEEQDVSSRSHETTSSCSMGIPYPIFLYVVFSIIQASLMSYVQNEILAASTYARELWKAYGQATMLV